MSSVTERTTSPNKDGPSLAKTMKRCNKPLMERRRRGRINESLNQLKGLVLEALKKDTSQYSKLEKADILEMTVRHLRNMQRQQLAMAVSQDSSVVGKYRAGFSECANEVTRYLGTVDGLSPEVRDRLMQHLYSCMTRSQAMQQQQPTNPIHVHIPVATAQQTLPGATVQSLLAASVQQSSPATTGASPQQRYVGAFQVIHGSMTSPEMAALMSQVTPVGVPVYMVPSQHGSTASSSISSVSSRGTSECSASPASSPELRQPSPEPIHYVREREPLKSISPYSRQMTKAGCMKKNQMAAQGQVVMKDIIREEKVWRPW